VAKPMRDLGTQGKPSGVNTAAPKKSGVPGKAPSPDGGSTSFRGKQPSGTKANDSKKAK